MLPIFGLSLLFSIALCVHVVRTGQQMYWLMIILLFQPLGGIVYLAAIVLPSLSSGPTARRLQASARETLDPTREYRQARAATDEAPTVHNQMRLAKAAAALGHWEEARDLYAEAARGIHADDPVLLLGLANAELALGRHAQALTVLERLGQSPDQGRTPQAALALGRAYEGLGRTAEADTAYAWAAERLPGLEGFARYAAFLGRTGRTDQAREMLAEIDRRVARTDGRFRKEARAWRDLAARDIRGA